MRMNTASRSGVRTSELWLILAFFGVVLLSGTTYFTVPTEHITMLSILAFGYGGGRIMLKNTLAKQA